MLQFDAAGFEDALGLAGTQSAGLMAAQFEAMCKRMHHGFSARAGLYAAWLAADGYTAIKRVFEREYGGYLATFGEGHSPDTSQVSKGLGEHWETDRIVVKPYAAMGGLHAPIDAVRKLREQRPFQPEEIANIDVWVKTAVFHHGASPVERPLTSVGAQVGAGRRACARHAGRLTAKPTRLQRHYSSTWVPSSTTRLGGIWK